MNARAMGKLTRDDQLSCSQLPALFGLSRYQTSNDILRTCTNAMDGIARENIENEAMSWGTILEGTVARVAADRLGFNLIHGFTAPFQAKDVALACSLDGKLDLILNKQYIETCHDQGIFVLNDSGKIDVDSTGILEIKVTSVAPEDSPALERGPLQLQGQMICTGATWGAVAVLYRGTELRIFVFEAHKATQDAIRQKAHDFEARLVGYKQTGLIDWYPIQSPEDGARVFNEPVKEEIELPDDAAKWAAQLADAKKQIEIHEDRASEATKKLMDMIGVYEVARAGHWTINWGSRSFSAQPAKTVPAKDAYTVRNKTLKLREAA